MTRSPYELRVCGRTTDGKKVATGAYRLTCTHGVPLEVILFFLSQQNAVLDWLDYTAGCLKDGHNRRTIRARILTAVGDVYGPAYRRAFAERLDLVLPEPTA